MLDRFHKCVMKIMIGPYNIQEKIFAVKGNGKENVKIDTLTAKFPPESMSRMPLPSLEQRTNTTPDH